jgi:hypothetical protein
MAFIPFLDAAGRLGRLLRIQMYITYPHVSLRRKTLCSESYNVLPPYLHFFTPFSYVYLFGNITNGKRYKRCVIPAFSTSFHHVKHKPNWNRSSVSEWTKFKRVFKREMNRLHK